MLDAMMLKETGKEKPAEATLAQLFLKSVDYKWSEWHELAAMKTSPAAEKAIPNKATVAENFIEFSPNDQMAITAAAKNGLHSTKEDVPNEKLLAKAA